MKFAEWQKLDKEEKIKQASSSIMIGSVDFGLGDNTDEFINLLRDIPEISALDLLIDGGARRQRETFLVLAKYLTQDQHLSTLTIRSTYQKGDFFSNEKHYGELEIFKALAINTSLIELRISCYNITPNDIENFLASIRKNPKSKLQKVTFLHNAWFNNDQGNQDWHIEQEAINDYLAIRPLEITLTTTIDKFKACASALSKELVDNLTTISEELKKYDKYRKMPENPNFSAVKAIKAVIALADANMHLVDDHNKLTRAAQCYDIFNELDDSIDIISLDTNKLISLIDMLIAGTNVIYLVNHPLLNRLEHLKTKTTPNTLLETEYEEIFGFLKAIKGASYAFTMQTYQELSANYPAASRELGSIYFHKAPKYKILAALYFFQAGMNANQELLRACKQLMLTTFADKLDIDTAKNEQLNYFLKLQFNLQALLKNETTDELTSACNHVLNLITPETAIENKGFVPQQEIADQLENLTVSVFPEDKKVEQSCEVIIKHMKGQQPKPDDMTTPDRDALYTMTQKYLEEYSPKFGKPLTEAEKSKQPLRYAVAVYVRILLELSDPIIQEKSTELLKRLRAAKHLWHKLTTVLPFYQEVKQIFESIFIKHTSNYKIQYDQEFNLSLAIDPKNLTVKHFNKMIWLWRQAQVSNLELKMQVVYLGLAIEELKSIINPDFSKVESLIISFIEEFAKKLEKAATQNILKDMPSDLRWMERHSNFKAALFIKKIFSSIKEESSGKTKEVLDFYRLQIQLKKLTTQGATATLIECYKQKRAAITSLPKAPNANSDQKESKEEETPTITKLG